MGLVVVGVVDSMKDYMKGNMLRDIPFHISYYPCELI